jgi:hypothetical protein
MRRVLGREAEVGRATRAAGRLRWSTTREFGGSFARCRRLFPASILRPFFAEAVRFALGSRRSSMTLVVEWDSFSSSGMGFRLT